MPLKPREFPGRHVAVENTEQTEVRPASGNVQEMLKREDFGSWSRKQRNQGDRPNMGERDPCFLGSVSKDNIQERARTVRGKIFNIIVKFKIDSGNYDL